MIALGFPIAYNLYMSKIKASIGPVVIAEETIKPGASNTTVNVRCRTDEENYG